MTAMERRRLQVYARSTRLQYLQRQIDVLEELLGPLYREAEQWAQPALTIRAPKSRGRRDRGARRSGAGR